MACEISFTLDSNLRDCDGDRESLGEVYRTTDLNYLTPVIT
jgi:hypothetical protein